MHTNLKSVLARTLALALTFITGSALAGLSPVLEITASQLKSVEWSDAGVATIGGWTISLNGNTLNDDGTISISPNATAGVTIHFPAAVSQYTAAIKYSGYQKAASNYTALLDFKNSSSAYVGALDSSGARAFYVDMVYTSFANQIVGSSNTPAINESGVMAISYQTGGHGLGFFIDNNDRTALVATRRDGITWRDSTISDFVIGGLISGQSHASIKYPTSLTISDIAIFSDYAIKADDAQAFSDYKFLSERTFDTELYEPFLENFSDRIMTITSAGNAADAKDLGSNAGTFALFDPTTGMDTLTQFLGRTQTTLLPGYSNSTLAWQGFCNASANGHNAYSAPGLVMRFAPYVAGRSVVVGGEFSPLNLGGLIVEEGASSGQTIPALQQGGDRATTFGDMRTEGAVPTFFILKDSFKLNRNGATTIYGDATFDIAEGKSFVCNTNNASQPVTLQSGAIFRAVGGGTFTVATLTATGAVTLDYSAQTLERLAEGTPYIAGTLAVDASTTIILPTDAQPSVAYKLATTISGDTIAALKLGEEDIPDGATIVLNELNGTVSYIEGKCEKDIEGAVDYSQISWSKTPTAIDLATLNAADGTELTFDTTAEFMQLDIIAAGDLTLNVNDYIAHPVAVKLQEGVESATITLTKGGDGFLATPIAFVAGCKVVVGVGATLADLGSCTVVLSATDSFTLTAAPSQIFVGAGTLVYDGVIPSVSQRTIFADSTQWTGTVWLKNLELTDANFDMSNYGNVDSKIKLTGITGYAAQASNPGVIDCSVPVELVDEDGVPAVDLSNGFSNIYQHPEDVCTYTFAKITGSGTFKNSDGSCAPQYRFVDVADFTGTLWVASNMRFVVGKGTGFGDSQKITIDSDSNIKCMLEANGGLVNNATVTLKGGATLTFAAGQEGSVVVEDGSLRLTLTEAQVIAGYTAENVTLPQGQNIVFIKPDGTEVAGEGAAFGGEGVLWTGKAGDGLWATAENWSNNEVPTAESELSIKDAAEITLAAGDTCSNLVLNANVTFKGDVSALGTVTVNAGETLTFEVPEDGAMIVSNAINGAGQVVKSGAGTITMTKTSGYTGGTIIEEGGLVFGPNDMPIGPYALNATVWTTNAVVKSGAWLDLNGRWDQTYVVLLEADASLLNNGADIGTGVRQTKMVVLDGNATVGGTGAFGIHNAGDVQSKLELGEYTLTKMGTNAFDLVNTTIAGTGTIAIEEGSLRTYSSPSTAANATLTFAEGTSAEIGANLTVKDLVLNGAPITGAGVLTATGVIGGEQALVKRGNGTLRLNAANTYTGGTVVEQGTLQLGNYKALGGGSKTVKVWRGGAVDTLDANGVNDAYSLIFADDGEGATAKLLKSTTGNQGVGKTYPIRYLSLETDGEIAVPNAASGFGLVGQGFNATTIALSTNTLTKTGAGQFILCNTTIDGTGVIDVRAGELAVLHGDTTAADATLNLASGSTLNVGTGNDVGTLTVKNLTGSGTITGGGIVTVAGTMDASYASSENVVPESGSTMLISDSSGCPVEITNIPLSGTLFVDLTDEVVAALVSSPIGTKVAKFSPVIANGIKLSDHAKQAFEALNLRLAKGTDADGSVIFATAKPTGFQLILR